MMNLTTQQNSRGRHSAATPSKRPLALYGFLVIMAVMLGYPTVTMGFSLVSPAGVTSLCRSSSSSSSCPAATVDSSGTSRMIHSKQMKSLDRLSLRMSPSSSSSPFVMTQNNNTRSFTTTTTSLDEKDDSTVVSSSESTDSSSETTVKPTNDDRPSAVPTVDIVLNTNAKGITNKVVELVHRVAAAKYSEAKIRIHTTSTLEEARAAARQIVNTSSSSSSNMVIPMGGDGTLTTLLQLLWEAHQEQEQESLNGDHPESDDGATTNDTTTTTTSHTGPVQFPLVGYIAMGTGNALGSVVGCRPPRTGSRWKRMLKSFRKRNVLEDTLEQLLQVAAASTDSPQPPQDNIDIVEVPLLQVTTTTTSSESKQEQSRALCFFAGVGFDSLMLQDFKNLQEWTSTKPFWKESLSSVLGYTVALFTRTLPQCLSHQKHLIQVELTTQSPESTVWIDHRRGDVVRSITSLPMSSNDKDSSTLLYRGQAGIVAVGSAPFYGGGLRLFPFARMSPKGMQVRIGRIHPLRGTLNIPRIFAGSYRDTRDDTFGCLDYMGDQFSLKLLSGGYPVQHSGDFIGTTSQVEFAMIPDQLKPIRFVTLLPPRLIVEQESKQQ